MHLHDELLASEGAGVLEALILQLLLDFRWVILFGVFESMVISVHDRGKTESTILKSLCDAGFEDWLAVVGGDAIVIGVKGFNKVVVDFLVEEFSILAVCCKTSLKGNDVFAEVLVDESGRGELGLVGGVEGLLEATLVVIVAGI